jgi:hypothetical protein
MILFPLFASGVLTPVSSTPAVPVENLPSVSLIQVKKFATSVVVTGGKYSTSVLDTSGLGLQISPRFFEKFGMTLMLFSGAWGKMIHEKKPEAKNLVTLSLSQNLPYVPFALCSLCEGTNASLFM